MRSLLVLGLLGSLLLQDAAPEAERPDWRTSFAAFRAAVEEGDAEAARAAGEPWLAAADASERQRAALRFGLGLVAARGEDPAPWSQAVVDFQDAAALAGPGSARLDAIYDAGRVKLQDGERLRATIPEIAGDAAGGAQPMLAPPGPGGLPGAPPTPGAPGQDAPQTDPLQAARTAYLAARELLVQRLRSDWRDADTRANLELVQRRLRELDEIERQREEQRQQQEEQQQQQQQDSQDQQQDGEQQDQDQQQDQQQDQKDGEQGDQQQDPNGERRPNQEDPSGEEARQEPSPEEQAAEDEQQQQQAGQEQQQQQQQGEEGSAASQLEDQERHLTREETMRLLDRLAELEAEARALQARLQRAQRESVERDW